MNSDTRQLTEPHSQLPPQFSVKAALVLMTVAGVGMTLWRIEVDRRAEKSEALARIWQLGGDHETYSGETHLIGFYGEKFTDDEFAMLSNFSKTRMLGISNTPATDKALAPVAAMQELENLQISECEFTGDGFKYLTLLPALEQLHIDDVPIDDRAVDHLLAMRSLKTLYIGVSRLSDKGIARLKRHSTAQEVYVEGGYDEWMAELESSEQNGAANASVEE